MFAVFKNKFSEELLEATHKNTSGGVDVSVSTLISSEDGLNDYEQFLEDHDLDEDYRILRHEPLKKVG